MNNIFNKTKIIATLGPASSSRSILKKMIEAGVNVFRINFSHGSYEDHKMIINHIRDLNEELNTCISILIDLQGPKLRIGLVENDRVVLNDDDFIYITTKECIGNSSKVHITYQEFPKDVAIGDFVLIDDGKIKLLVEETNRLDLVKARIIHGGILSSKKGVNLPNTKISLPCLTEKDLKDLHFALENDVEWIGLSFVRTVNDILELRHKIELKNKRARIIAKIEKPEALIEIDEIIKVSDGIMVARGDLGVEMPVEEVPIIQKEIVKKCIAASKPVIIATQMMESMVYNFSPTRAEVNDVANSVIDGADAVMLSGETSIGKFPVKVVEYMHKIIIKIERESYTYNRTHFPDKDSSTYISDSICFNACTMAYQVGAKAIIGMTNSGYTAFKVSSHRPQADIFIFTDNKQLLKSIGLVWGIRALYFDKYISTSHTITSIKNILKTNKLVSSGDIVINIGSIPMREKGRANMLKISEV
jgi:pyruvate kinase